MGYSNKMKKGFEKTQKEVANKLMFRMDIPVDTLSDLPKEGDELRIYKVKDTGDRYLYLNGTYILQMYPMMTKEFLKKTIESVFKDKLEEDTNERKFVLWSYCAGINGPKKYSDINLELCDHPECGTCRSYEKAFKEEAEKWANDTLKDVKYPDPNIKYMMGIDPYKEEE